MPFEFAKAGYSILGLNLVLIVVQFYRGFSWWLVPISILTMVLFLFQFQASESDRVAHANVNVVLFVFTIIATSVLPWALQYSRPLSQPSSALFVSVFTLLTMMTFSALGRKYFPVSLWIESLFAILLISTSVLFLLYSRKYGSWTLFLGLSAGFLMFVGIGFLWAASFHRIASLFLVLWPAVWVYLVWNQVRGSKLQTSLVVIEGTLMYIFLIVIWLLRGGIGYR